MEGGIVALEVRDSRNDAEVRIAALEIEAAKQFAVIGQAIGIIAVGRRKELPPCRFTGGDHITQLAVAEHLVTDEVDRGNLGPLAFHDLENEVHTVLRKLNYLGLDRGGETPAATIEFDHPGYVALHLRARIDHTRLKLHFVLQIFFTDRAVTFKGNAVDDRVFDHRDNQARAIKAH